MPGENNYGRVEEQIQGLRRDTTDIKEELRSMRTAIAQANEGIERRFSSQISELEAEVKEIDRRTRNVPVIQQVVFGLVGLILVSVIGAIVALVIVKGPS